MADNTNKDYKDKVWGLAEQVQRNGWHIEKELISTVGIGLIAKPPKGCWGKKEIWKNLENLLGIIRDISIQADFLCPIVVGLHDVKEEKELLFRWQRDQDWHRGNFILFPYEVEDDDSSNIKAILNPHKVDLQSYIPESVDTAKIIEGLKENEEIEEGLKDLIIEHLVNIYENDVTEWERYWENKIENWIADKTDNAHEPKKTEGQKGHVEVLDNRIGKIASISIKDFKGIKESHKLDVNADLVLITGPNGNGKSSFIEALTLALTGFHPEAENGVLPDHFFHYGAEELTVEIEGKEGEYIRLQATKGGKGFVIENGLEIKRKQLSETQKKYHKSGSGKLLFRLTSFLPEYVRLLFDEEVTEQEDRSDELSPADVLSELFKPFPIEVRTLFGTLRKKQKGIEETIEKEKQNRQDIQNMAEHLEQASDWSEKLVNIINPLLKALDIEGVKLPSIEEKDIVKKQVNLYNNLRKELEHSLSVGIDFSIGGMYRLYDHIKRKIEAKYGAIDLEELKEEKKRLLNQKEKIEEELIEYNECLEKLSNIFEALSDRSFLSGCIDMLQNEKGFNDIAEELRLVDTDKAEIFKKVIGIKGTISKKKDQIDNMLKEVDKKIENAHKLLPYHEQLKEFKRYVDDSNKMFDNISSFLDLYNNSKSDEEYLSQLDYKLRQLKTLESFLDNQQILSEEFMEIFNKAINKVLKRFAMTRGLEAVAIDRRDRGGPGYKIHAKENGQCNKEDRRTLPCFSLGQRAQIGLAWMLASRELVENSKDIDFPHRAIVLDDPTAAFDMTNLLSNVLLCRQLAYHPEPSRRYQLFIVSHHEEFTDRLLDLLCPPGKDCSMHLVRFSDWTPDTGAKIECFKVEPAPYDFDKAIAAFRKGLQYLRSYYGSPS